MQQEAFSLNRALGSFSLVRSCFLKICRQLVFILLMEKVTLARKNSWRRKYEFVKT